MGYQALLFCPDEKTARTVTHVLHDLDFAVEPCTEPFAAVKRLMAQHFDAVVVDCDNEQNATLLFKSARNSTANQTSLAVAVVEGQAGVAKAFRIGANLVLTKPINVEQAKGTLRVARGLLRKGADGSKGTPAVSVPQAATPATAPVTPAVRPTAPTPTTRPTTSRLPPLAFAAATAKPSAPVSQPPPVRPAPAATASSRVAEADKHQIDLILDTDDAEVLERPPAPETKPASSAPTVSSPGMPRNFPWQPASKPLAEPMASAMRRAAEVASKVEPQRLDDSVAASGQKSRGVPSAYSPTQRAASAPAPAKERVQAPEAVPQHFVAHNIVAPPAVTLSPTSVEVAANAEPVHAEQSPSSSYSEHDSSSPTFFPGAYDPDEVEGGSKTKAIVIIAAVVLLAISAGYLSWKDTRSKRTAQAATAPVASAPESGTPNSEEANAPDRATQPAVNDITIGATKVASVPASKTPASKPAHKEPAAEAQPDTEPEVTQRLIVRNETHRPTPPPAHEEPLQGPGAIDMRGAADPKALANIGSAPVNVPKPAPQVLRVSQGVMEGLVLKKVQPKYPPQAMQLRIQGAVQLQATISKTGDITNLKVLSGDGLLSRSAQEAVKQWKYKPYYLNGEPVEIQTQILVNFKLPN